MKKLLILFSILICLAVGSSVSATRLIGSGVTNGAVRGASLVSETFEAMIDDEEWDDDGDWVEADNTTNVMIADTGIAGIPQGSVAGMIVGQGSDAGRMIYDAFTAQNGKVSLDYDLRFSGDPADDSLIVLWLGKGDDVETVIVNMLIDPSGNLQIKHNATQTTIANINHATWYEVEVELDCSIATGINAIKVWVNGTEYGPYDTADRNDPADTAQVMTHPYYSNTGLFIWVDMIDVYVGARVAD